MTKQIKTLHTDYRECILDIDIYGRIISAPQQSLDELTETLFEEFKRRNPLPTLESKRYELSRLVSQDYSIAYDGELELQDGEELVDLQNGKLSMPALDFEDLSGLIIPQDVRESFRYEDGCVPSIRQEIVAKYDLETGEEFKPGVGQTEAIVGSTEEDRSTYMSEEQIANMGRPDEDELAESSEEAGEFTGWGSSALPEPDGVPEVDEDYVDYPTEEPDDESEGGEADEDSDDGYFDSLGYDSDEESEQDSGDELSDYDSDEGSSDDEDDSGDFADYDSSDESEGEEGDEDSDDLSDYDSYGESEEDSDDLSDYDSYDEADGEEQPKESAGSDEESDDFADYGDESEEWPDLSMSQESDEESDDLEAYDVGYGDEDEEEPDLSMPQESDDEDDDSDYFEALGSDDEGASEDEDSDDGYFEALGSGGEDISEDEESYDDLSMGSDAPDVDDFRVDDEPEFMSTLPPPPPPRPVQRPQPPVQPQQSSSPQVDKSSEPTDIRAFLRKHPRCDYSFALQYFTKKQIDDAIRIGKIIKKGNTLKI